MKKAAIETSWADGAPVPALIGIGSNLGDRRRFVFDAIERVKSLGGVIWLRQSSLRETRPVGGPMQDDYLNGAGLIETNLDALELLRALQSIEAELGRVRDVNWGPRTIDLDLLLFGDYIISTESLEVPHPRLLERGFVLEPLAEIAGEFRHPASGRTMADHWEEFRRRESE